MNTPVVLFVCVHNAGRSVIAEAILNARASGRATAMSAGTDPAATPHAEVIEALAEIGLDAPRGGRLLTDDLVEAATRVITMGCAVDADACPAMRYADTEDWGLPDPKGRSLEQVRAIRDEIAARVEALIESLGSGGAG